MDSPPVTRGVNRIAVLGLGNPVVGDDRVGLAVAHEVSRLLDESPVPGVTVLESMRGGFELLDLLSGYDRAVIVDCMVSPDPCPGRVHRLSLDHVEGSVRLLNAHELGIHDVFRFARELNMPMPRDVEIIGIEGQEMGMLTEQMSPVVEAVVEKLAREIHESLK